MASFLSSFLCASFSSSASLFPFNLPSNPWKGSKPVRVLTGSRFFKDAPSPNVSSLQEMESLGIAEELKCFGFLAPKPCPGFQPWEQSSFWPYDSADWDQTRLFGS